jgi:hypothetical protein
MEKYGGFFQKARVSSERKDRPESAKQGESGIEVAAKSLGWGTPFGSGLPAPSQKSRVLAKA